MTKKVVRFFQENIGVTPSVAAPGDTNPSDATGPENTCMDSGSMMLTHLITIRAPQLD